MLRMFRRINGKQRKHFPDGKEYLLDNNGDIKKMNYKDAINFINTYGLSEDNIEIYKESVG